MTVKGLWGGTALPTLARSAGPTRRSGTYYRGELGIGPTPASSTLAPRAAVARATRFALMSSCRSTD
jgi:hypothetical protein